MKIRATSLLLICFCAHSAQAANPNPSASAYQQAVEAQSPTPSPGADLADPSKIDPAKEADIRQLLVLTGAATTVNQMMDSMQKSMRPLMLNALPPGEYREKLIDLFFERFRSKAGVQHILDLTVRLYDKYLTAEDIKGLIQFYSSPLGKKSISVLPQLMAEMQSESSAWGSEMGRQAMMEVLSEHPDLAKAIEDAQKSAKPQ